MKLSRLLRFILGGAIDVVDFAEWRCGLRHSQIRLPNSMFMIRTHYFSTFKYLFLVRRFCPVYHGRIVSCFSTCVRLAPLPSYPKTNISCEPAPYYQHRGIQHRTSSILHPLPEKENGRRGNGHFSPNCLPGKFGFWTGLAFQTTGSSPAGVSIMHIHAYEAESQAFGM